MFGKDIEMRSNLHADGDIENASDLAPLLSQIEERQEADGKVYQIQPHY